jgi:hypothetical protein
MDQIAEYENAAHDYVQDGVRLLELRKKDVFSVQTAKFKRKTEVAEFQQNNNFVCSNSTWKDQTLTATFRPPLMHVHLLTRPGKEKGHRNLFQRPFFCMAGHTGQSSQLFPVAPGRNDQFLATIDIVDNTRGALVQMKKSGVVEAK